MDPWKHAFWWVLFSISFFCLGMGLRSPSLDEAIKAGVLVYDGKVYVIKEMGDRG